MKASAYHTDKDPGLPGAFTFGIAFWSYHQSQNVLQMDFPVHGKVKDMFSWFENLKIGIKVGLGFLAVIAIFAFAIFFIFNETRKIGKVGERVMQLRAPTAQMSLMMLNGINHSQAALRGWMLLGEDQFRKERQRAWSTEIDLSLKALTALSVNWTHPQNKQRLQTIKEKLEEFRRFQQEIEGLVTRQGFLDANSDASKQARHLLKTKAASTAFEIEKILGAMVFKQKQLLQIDLAESERLSERLNLFLWAILGVGLAVNLGIAIPIVGSLGSRIHRITEFSKRMAKGDFKQVKIEITANDDLGILANNLNAMTFELIKGFEDREAMTQSIIESVVDPLIMIDEMGIIEIFNPSAEKTFGYTTAEVIGKNVKMLMPEPYHGEHDGYLKNYRDTGEAKVIGIGREVLGQRKGGSVFPLDLAINEFVVGDQRRFVGICRDITERKEAVQKLQESKENLEKQNWLKTALGELNDTMRGEMDPVKLSQNIINYLAERINAQIGAIYLRANGTLNLTASYAYTKPKNFSTTFQIGENLVGQAALEKKTIVITEAPQDYIKVQSGLGNAVPRNILIVPFLFEGTVLGVIELGSLEEINHEQMELLNWAVDSIAINLNSANTRSRMQELLNETQAQAEELTEQQDEMRQQQEEIRQTNRHLKKQTKTLEKQNLEIGNKNRIIRARAEELALSSKYKSEFLANMSHELRTPLNSLLILAQLLGENKEGNLTDKQIEFARTIQGSGEDLLNLINDILDLAKVESGQMEAHVQKIDLREWTARIEKNLAYMAAEKGLSLTTEIGDGVPAHIFSDSQRLGQICKNLLSNAFKFTTEGDVTLAIKQPDAGTVFSRPDLDPGSAIAISVSDTGKGIPPDKQKLIFEAFRQEDGSISRKYGGTGLGLSITRELVQLLGGEIRLQSQPGQGSMFTVFLPLELREGQRPAPALIEGKDTQDTSPASEVSTDQSKETGEKIPLLVVEDDVRFGGLMAQLAHQQGFESIVAGTGEMGYKYAHSHRPKAIIMDLGLPGMEGFQVMRKLRESPYTRDIPVYVISGQGKEREAMAHGAVGYLEKPVSKEKLGEVFTKLGTSIVDKPKTVLIAEDDSGQRQSIHALLGKIENIETIGVPTSREALDLLNSRCIDCLILDLGLPGGSGEELLDQIKYNEILKYVPVIIYTGRDLSRKQEMSLKKYSQSIIIKGVKSPDRLLDEVKVFLFGFKDNLLVLAEEQNSKKKIESELDLTGKKILLVDDDMRNVFALTHVLEEKGMSVIIGKTGLEALEQIKAEPEIDLVLMDIMMPEMDGFEAIKRIRQDLKLENLPIIAVTAKAMKGDREKCLNAGASDYMTKPIANEEFLLKIYSWLKDS